MNNYNINNDKKELKPMITLFKAQQSLSKLVKEDIKKYDFDLNEFGVFEVMYHYKTLRVSDVNEKVLVNSSSLTYILDKLVSKDLIKREKDLKDKRVINISLTNIGQEIGDKLFPEHYKMLTEVFNILSNSEKEQLANLLKKVGLNAEEFGDNK